jgi:hypothetical protein
MLTPKPTDLGAGKLKDDYVVRDHDLHRGVYGTALPKSMLTAPALIAEL